MLSNEHQQIYDWNIRAQQELSSAIQEIKEFGLVECRRFMIQLRDNPMASISETVAWYQTHIQTVQNITSLAIVLPSVYKTTKFFLPEEGMIVDAIAVDYIRWMFKTLQLQSFFDNGIKTLNSHAELVAEAIEKLNNGEFEGVTKIEWQGIVKLKKSEEKKWDPVNLEYLGNRQHTQNEIRTMQETMQIQIHK